MITNFRCQVKSSSTLKNLPSITLIFAKSTKQPTALKLKVIIFFFSRVFPVGFIPISFQRDFEAFVELKMNNYVFEWYVNLLTLNFILHIK